MPLGILGGTLLASALKALFDVGGTLTQNQYNSPKAQLKRLRQAGLPLSYMYQGKVNQQSDSPKLSIDPTLGTLPKLQGDKLTSETTAQNIENQVKQGELDVLKKVTTTPDGFTGTNQEINMLSERNTKYAEMFIKQHEQRLKEIEKFVEENAFTEGIQIDQKRQALKKAVQMVKNLLAQEGLMGQLQSIRGLEEKLNQSLTEDLDSMPEWISALLKVILVATKRRS